MDSRMTLAQFQEKKVQFKLTSRTREVRCKVEALLSLNFLIRMWPL
jgi:hypothetical protein